MSIAENKVVSFHYTLKNSEGEVLDSSEGQEPLAYLHGHGGIIPGLENAMAGKVEGDSFEVNVKPEDGYGEINAELIQAVSRDAFQGVDEIEPGMRFQTESPEGHAQIIVVKEVAENEVIIDANHELAGEELNFAIEVVAIRDASAEELDHGHVH